LTNDIYDKIIENVYISMYRKKLSEVEVVLVFEFIRLSSIIDFS